MILKYLIRLKGINEAFSGGMSSFLLFTIVYAYYQYLSNNDHIDMNEFNMGSFLIGFLRFFSDEFDYKEYGISIRNGGYFFKKRENTKIGNNGLLSVENFQDEKHDIGKNNYRFETIRNYYRLIYKRIEYNLNNDSPLSAVIKLK